MKKILISIVLILTMVFMVGFNSEAYTLVNLKKADGSTNVTYRGSSTVVKIPDSYKLTTTEFRAAWVSTFVSDIDQYKSEQAWKNEVASVLKVFKEFNLNAMIFHVRTHNNALYKSELNPIASWWKYVDFDKFDPLEYLIDECHKAGIEFHAWMNPYRISTNTTDIPTAIQNGQYLGEALPSVNVANKAENLIKGDGGVILNPGLQVVRDFIVDTCMEVVENYDVDAIHFDDYFYIKNSEDADTFAKNNPTNLSLANWRRRQVDLFIEQLHDEMTAYNEENNRAVQLGISPSGIYKNGNGSVSSGSNTAGFAHYGDYLYSDTYKWANEGWIDYLLPQSYWGFEHPSAGYADVMDWWDKAMANNDCLLYSGIGVYMADEKNNTYSWQTNTKELTNQLTYLTKLSNVQGYSFYSFKYLENAYNNKSSKAITQINNAKTAGCFDDVALVPEIENMNPIRLSAVKNFNQNGNTLTWDKSSNAKAYVIYRSKSDLSYSVNEIVDVIGNTSSTITWKDSVTGTYNYGVKPLSRTNTLGKGTSPAIGDSASFEILTDNSDNASINGTEVTENGGMPLGNTIQVGYTRCVFLSSDAPTSSRLSYNFSSSNEKVATISEYGTIKAIAPGKTTIRAEYKEDPNRWSEIEIQVYAEKGSMYNVIFKDDDGKVLKTEVVQKGKDAAAPIMEDKVVNGNYYKFIGWDKTFTNVQGNLEVTAKYQLEVAICEVKFVNYDGKVLKTEYVQKGNSATPPSNPTKPSSEYYDYEFVGWDKDYKLISGDIVITAKFKTVERDVKKYTVTFYNYDNTVLSVQEIKVGKDATAPSNPTRPDTAEYRFEFNGWDKDFTNVQEDLDVYAVYIATEQKYLVTFKDLDGNVLKETIVVYGASVQAPTAPEVEGYEFVGWSEDTTKIVKSMVVTPVYKEIQVVTNITHIFIDRLGETIDTIILPEGETVKMPDAPIYEGYTFIRWDKEEKEGTIVYTAVYEEVELTKEYTVVFKDNEGNVLKTEVVKEGASAVAPNAPEIEGYEFTGWDKDFSNIKSDLEVIAQYKEIIPEQNNSGCKKDLSIVIVSLISLVSVSLLIWKREK